ncbi:MAG: two-component regulator propeller domain-containing protein, partial [Rhodothermales bacterium]
MEAPLRRLRWLIVVLVIGIVLPVRQGRGQAPARLTLDPAKAITQYSHTTWTTADGLPQNTIGAMVQTRDGYLWLGTQEGLVRFDGATFTVFDRKNVDAFKVNAVQDLVEAADGTLWIGMRGGGVVAYAGGHFTAFTSEAGLSSDYIMDLHADPDGALWVGTYQGGLNRYHAGVFTHYDAEKGLPGDQISVIYRDPDGVLFVATEVGLFRFQGEAFVPASEDALADAFLTALYVDRQGARWAGTRDGRLLQIKDGRVIDHSAHVAQPGSYLRVILEDTQGSLWFGMRGSGLYRYRDGHFDAFTLEHGLSHDA